jgi:hypothetical protein
MKHCPHCNGEIQDAAIECRHCRRDLGAGDSPSVQSLLPADAGADARSYRTVTESDARLLRAGEVIYLEPSGTITKRAQQILSEKQVTVIERGGAVADTAPTSLSTGETAPASPTPGRRHWGRLGIAVVTCLLAVIAYEFLGFYSIQPIGAVPDGQTWLVLRADDEQFFESADARCLRRLGSVSLLSRAVALGQAPKDRILIRLPYWRFAYLQSTDGQEFGR